MQNSKSNNIFITLGLFIFLIIVFVLVSRLVFSSSTALISPVSLTKSTAIATPVPTPAFNPPKVIKYDSSTDLKKELDSIDPAINNSDFKDLLDLTDSLKSP